MPSRGGDRIAPRVGLAALSFAMSMKGPPQDQAVVVTVPLQEPDLRPSSLPRISVSADGRFVAFVAAAPLVAADTNDRDDIYVLDRLSGDVTLETAGATPFGDQRPVISGTGRFLVYETAGHMLVIRDRIGGGVRPIQRGGERPNGPSHVPSMTADGRYVAFASAATNLVDSPDLNDVADDVYVADMTDMTIEKVMSGTAGSPSAIVSSSSPAISDDGRFVAYSSTASTGTADGHKAAPAMTNIYLFDRQTRATRSVSVSASGAPPDGSSFSPAISSDGRVVAFVSLATNLAGRQDRNRVPDIYVRDTVARVTELISRTPFGHAGNGASRHPALSGDGRTVVFQSDASDLTCGERCSLGERDINLVADIFRYDRVTKVAEVISRGRTSWMEPSVGPAADRSARVIAFASRHPLDQLDDRHDYDLFVWAKDAVR